MSFLVAIPIVKAFPIPQAAKIGTNFGKIGTLVKNPKITVDWNSVTSHALKRMSERGISEAMVEKWVSTGKVLQQGADKYIYISKEGAAIMTSAGKLITAYGKEYFDSSMQQVVNVLFP